MNYFIADPHFGHQNIIHLCNRPFTSIEEMDNTMIARWNTRIHTNDNIYIIGDMFYHCTPEHVLEILEKLKGQKHLIIGNHDGWRTSIHTENYFKSINYMTEIYDGHHVMTLCHYPLLSWRKQKKTYMIYGHIHADTSQDFWPCIMSRDNMLNAGVEINNYMPVTFEELIINNSIFKESLSNKKENINDDI